jgi:hypothetical protein
MTRKILSLSLGASFIIAGAISMQAHHSISAEFDTSKRITFSGTVKQVDWGNPHIYTHVEVKEGDKVIVYKVEGAAPNDLFRQGKRKDDVKVGEKVNVTGIRAKNPESTNVGQANMTNAAGQRIF